MKNTHKLLLTAATVAVLGGTIISLRPSPVAASTTSNNPMSEIVQKLADKFGLNKDEVQTVFDQSRAERQAEHQAENEARLTQLVTEGKLTESQKQLILAKEKELAASRPAMMDSLRDKGQTERRAAMEAERTALEAWAQANGIDPQYLMMRKNQDGSQSGRGYGRHFDE